MPLVDPVLTHINNIPFSWTSCSHFFNGLPYKGVTAVTYEESRETKLVHAAQQDGVPIGQTSGLYKVDNVSFTLLRSSAWALLQDLALLGAGSYGDAEWTYILNIFEPVPLSVPPQIPDDPQVVAIAGCRITKVTEKQEVGSDELVTEIGVTARYITRGPISLYSQIRSLLP